MAQYSAVIQFHFLHVAIQFVCVCVWVAQSCLTLCDPRDYSPPGSSVHEILQARILEWVAISFSRESSQPRGLTRVSHIAGRFFTVWIIKETHPVFSTPFIKEIILFTLYVLALCLKINWSYKHEFISGLSVLSH